MTTPTYTVTVTPAPSGGWLWSVVATPGGTLTDESPRPALTRQGALCSATRAANRWLKGEPPPKRDDRTYIPRKLPRGTKTVWFYDDALGLWWRDFGDGLRGEIWATEIEETTYYEWRLRNTKPTPHTARLCVLPASSMLSARASCLRAYKRYLRNGP